MKKAAVDLLLLAQREKYLSLLRQVLPVLEMGLYSTDVEAEYKKVKDTVEAVR